jgi:hypothetical protein
MTKYDKPRFVNLSAMEWETGAGDCAPTGSGVQTPGCPEYCNSFNNCPNVGTNPCPEYCNAFNNCPTYQA